MDNRLIFLYLLFMNNKGRKRLNYPIIGLIGLWFRLMLFWLMAVFLFLGYGFWFMVFGLDRWSFGLWFYGLWF